MLPISLMADYLTESSNRLSVNAPLLLSESLCMKICPAAFGLLAFAVASHTPAHASDGSSSNALPVGTSTADPIAARLSALEAKIEALEARNAELEGKLDKSTEQLNKSNRMVPTFSTADKATSFKLRGAMDIDYAAFHQRRGGYDYNNGTAVRRARLGFEGTAFHDFEWRIELDFAGNNVNLQDAYLQYKATPDLRLTLGQHKAPFGLDANTPTNYNVFLEKGMFHSAAASFGAEHKIGFSAAYNAKNFTITAGLFGENESISRSGSAVNSNGEGWGVNARATWSVVDQADLALHVGASGYWRTSPRAGSSKGIRLAERPNVRVDNGYIIDSGIITDANHAYYWGTEAAAIFGPVTLTGQYGQLRITRQSAQPDTQFDGFFIYGAWLLTGEQRGFKHGNFDRISPLNNVDGHGGWGAWEVALRYDDADLSNTPVASRAGNKAHSWTAGLNWYWNPNMKLQFNYIRFKGINTPLDPIGTRTAGDAFATRLHLDW